MKGRSKGLPFFVLIGYVTHLFDIITHRYNYKVSHAFTKDKWIPNFQFEEHSISKCIKAHIILNRRISIHNEIRRLVSSLLNH